MARAKLPPLKRSTKTDQFRVYNKKLTALLQSLCYPKLFSNNYKIKTNANLTRNVVTRVINMLE